MAPMCEARWQWGGTGHERHQIEDHRLRCFRAPDWIDARLFRGFGLQVVDQNGAAAVCAVGGGISGAAHDELGEPGFAGLGLRAASLDDLEIMATAEGEAVAPLDAPGGGKVVVLQDPDGHRIEVVAGQQGDRPLALARPSSWNSAFDHGRLRQLKRTAVGASHVVRLGHWRLKVSELSRLRTLVQGPLRLHPPPTRIACRPAFAGRVSCAATAATRHRSHTLFVIQHPPVPASSMRPSKWPISTT